MSTAALTNVDEILSNEIIIFKDRVRIDVQTSTPGLRFQDAWQRRKTSEYDNAKLQDQTEADSCYRYM